MYKEKHFKSLAIIVKNKTLRIFGILCTTFLILCIILASLSYSWSEKIKINNSQIELSQKKLSDLQYLVNADVTTDEDNLLETKFFAQYEEVIPFITFLESLFSIIDPNAEITIKSNEKQIFIDHFADYTINLKTNTKKELFFKALDELYNTQYITKLTAFTMNYKPVEEGKNNELFEVEFSIRLFLN